MKNTLKPAKQSNRNYGIDLLRCVAMALVVMLHTLSRSGLLDNTPTHSLKYEVMWAMEIVAYCAVNVFIIISGYVGLKSRFKLSRILLLWLQVVFYNVLLTLIVSAVNGSFDKATIIKAFLPVSTDAYWFFTQYFLLCFIMPFVNMAILHFKPKQNVFLLSIILFFTSVAPMIYSLLKLARIDYFNCNLFLENNGYSILWLTIVYTVGCVLRQLNDCGYLKKLNSFICFIVFVSIDAVTWAIHYAVVSEKAPDAHNFAISYTSPFVLFAGVFMVLCFSNLKVGKVSSKIIEFAGSSAFAVYLIHSQEAVYPIFKDNVEPILHYRTAIAVPCVLCVIAITFIIGIFSDKIRLFLEKLLHIDKLCKLSDKFTDRIFSKEDIK